jgi:hypothetical protein
MYRSLLVLTVVGVSVAGHFGALLTHGEDYLSSVLPFGEKPTAPGTSGANFAFASMGSNGQLTTKQIQDLNVEVRSILAHNCYSCHSATKTKGELRLDQKALIMKGGKHGVILKAGHPDESEMIRRIMLPADDKEAMPTKGKAAH